ncbi:MAG: B12-binding domain-containing radical SAM protein [Desulfatibacillaceae bacterium]
MTENRDKPTVVLINPRAAYANEIAQKCYPPLHLLYLASALEGRGFSPVVIDANAWAMPDGDIADRVADAEPFIVGLSAYSDVLPHVADLAGLVRRAAPGASVVLGGPHATSAPEKTLVQIPEADFILTGEADHSFPELCGRIAADAPVADVPGIWYRDDDGIVQGADREFPGVNCLPWPDRSLVADAYDAGLYHSLLVRRRPVDTLFTSRGCPFSCGFCYNFRKRYRARTPESVVQELAAIRQRGIRDVEITDDTFTVDEGRALAIFDRIIKERLDVSFRIKSRVDVFTEKLARRAAEAGVYLVAFGMESGSARMLDRMCKRITPEMSARARELCRQYGLACHSSWVVGYPGETTETVEETARFILSIKPTTANVALLRPYPDTPVYLEAQQAGTLVGEWSPDMDHLPWVRLPWAESRGELEAMVTKIMRRVYFRPYYVASFGMRALRGANLMLARYAVQEAKKVLWSG